MTIGVNVLAILLLLMCCADGGAGTRSQNYTIFGQTKIDWFARQSVALCQRTALEKNLKVLEIEDPCNIVYEFLVLFSVGIKKVQNNEPSRAFLRNLEHSQDCFKKRLLCLETWLNSSIWIRFGSKEARSTHCNNAACKLCITHAYI